MRHVFPGGGSRLPRLLSGRYDLLVIPALAGLTLVALVGLGELVSRHVFAEFGSEVCSSQSSTGVTTMKPNCTSYRKAAEGPLTVNAYNDCGYRSPDPCLARRPHSIRVALLGASTSQGMKVSYSETFAGRLAEALSHACGRPVEFQNMGVAGAGLLDFYRRLPEALALRPDLILLAFTPYELKAQISDEEIARRDLPPPAVSARADLTGTEPSASHSLIGRLSDIAFNSSLLVAAQHYLFQDRPTFVRLYMLHGEDADYLRVPLRLGWVRRLEHLDTLLGDMAAKSRAANVPMMVALAPQRIQASLLDDRVRPAGTDPMEIGRRIGAIAARHGIIFTDTLPQFAQDGTMDAGFYAVDGHLNAEGSDAVAHALAPRLLATTAFPACTTLGVASRS